MPGQKLPQANRLPQPDQSILVHRYRCAATIWNGETKWQKLKQALKAAQQPQPLT